MSTYRTSSADETIALGERLARELPRRGVVLLIGNLGAGKTTLAKGIVGGLGAASPHDVTSPTITRIHEYRAGRVNPVDLLRLEKPREVEALGLDDLIESGLVLIEWGERFLQLMPARRAEIGIRALQGDEREIEVILP